jgi:hypothetical protein
MFNPLHREVPVCPECRRPACIRQGLCQYCGAEVYIPIAYFRWLWFLVLTTLAVLGVLTFRVNHAGTWLLILLFLAIPIRVLWGILIPPWIERGVSRQTSLHRLVCRGVHNPSYLLDALGLVTRWIGRF